MPTPSRYNAFSTVSLGGLQTLDIALLLIYTVHNHSVHSSLNLSVSHWRRLLVLALQANKKEAICRKPDSLT